MRTNFVVQANPSRLGMALTRKPVHEPEDELVAAAKKGSSAAFGTLYQRYQRTMLSLAIRLTHNRQDAEDVLQESFRCAYTHLGGFRDESRFFTWLSRITINAALMKIRKRRSNIVSLDDHAESTRAFAGNEIQRREVSPEQRYLQHETNRILAEGIEHLPPIYRTVIQFYLVEELSIKEVAHLLGLSVAAVKSRIFRARLRLRPEISKYLDHQPTCLSTD